MVKSGDSLTKIAKDHGTTVNALRKANKLTTDKIKVGDKLKIPVSAASAPAPASAAPVAVDLDPLAAWMPADPDRGRVFLPPAGFGAAAGAWAPGRYVFVIRHGPGPTDAEWYGVEIVASGRESATPGSPVASQTAPGAGATASPGAAAP